MAALFSLIIELIKAQFSCCHTSELIDANIFVYLKTAKYFFDLKKPKTIYWYIAK